MICVVAAVSIFCLQQLQTMANSVTVSDYTLTVSKGSPAYSPEAPTTYKLIYTPEQGLRYERLINVNFSLKIEKRTARGMEDISDDVKRCSYEMSLSTGVYFYKSIPLDLKAPDTLSVKTRHPSRHYTTNNMEFYSSVTHIVAADTVGHKYYLCELPSR